MWSKLVELLARLFKVSLEHASEVKDKKQEKVETPKVLDDDSEKLKEVRKDAKSRWEALCLGCLLVTLYGCSTVPQKQSVLINADRNIVKIGRDAQHYISKKDGVEKEIYIGNEKESIAFWSQFRGFFVVSP